jgi:hypothetical protein
MVSIIGSVNVLSQLTCCPGWDISVLPTQIFKTKACVCTSYIHTYIPTYLPTYIHTYKGGEAWKLMHHTWFDNKVFELFVLKVLHTSLKNISVVTFKVLPLGTYAPIPARSPPFTPIL